MKKHFIFLFKYFLFWLLYFLLSKLVFLILSWSMLGELSLHELVGIFRYGLIMDISISSYLLLLLSSFLLFLLFFSKHVSHSFVRIYNLILIILVSLLNAIDMVMYPHWGIHLSFAIFNYLNEGDAIIASASIIDIVKGVFIAAGFSSLFFFIQKRFLFYEGTRITKKLWYLPFSIVLFNAFLIIPIRGGIDTSPLSFGSVSFSSKLFLNQAATNFLWNFGRTIEKRKHMSNPCNYMDANQSARVFNNFEKENIVSNRPQLIQSNDSTNVVLIILESFSNKVIPFLGGTYPACPRIDSLCRESTVFSSFYASGNRSDRGISAAIGGYPSLLTTSIIRFPSKVDKLKLLPLYFKEHNYHTFFYYGGDINFFDLRNFALKGGVEKIVSKSEFPGSIGNISKWGVPDEYLFNKVFEDMKKSDRPFFKMVYTISSHSPYDVPYHKHKGNSIDDRYLNSVAYTDSCLGTFIDSIKASSLWKNTLLIVTADHGAPQPGNTEITRPETYRIPLILSGGVITKSQVIDIIGMQPDLIPTLIHQLGWEKDSSLFGNDIFSSKPYAFYMMNFGWGYVTPEGEFFFDQNKMDFVTLNRRKDGNPDFLFAKAYMQQLHEDFLLK